MEKTPAAGLEAAHPSLPDTDLAVPFAQIRRNKYWLLAAVLFGATVLHLYIETLPPSPAEQKEVQSEELSAVGALLQEGEYIKAGHGLDRYLATHPDAASAHATRGGIYAHIGLYMPAIKEFTAAIGLVPSNPRYRHERANLYRKIGWTKKAHDDMTAILDAHPNDLQALIQRSSDGALLGRIREVITDLDLAVSLYPDNSQAYYLRIQLFEQINRPEEAAKSAAKLLEIGDEEQKKEAKRLLEKYGAQN